MKDNYFLNWFQKNVYQIIKILFLGSIILLILINRIIEIENIPNYINYIMYLIYGLYFGYSLCLFLSGISKKYDLKDRNN